VIGVPFAHVGGIPIEETLAAGGPALLTAFGVAVARLRARGIGKRGGSSNRSHPERGTQVATLARPRRSTAAS
jgi:hypothetical protein